VRAFPNPAPPRDDGPCPPRGHPQHPVHLSPTAPHPTLHPRRPVCVRIFGDNTELLIDRASELRNIVALNQMGFGAELLKTFTNGRIEEFIPCVTLTDDTVCLPRTQECVATLMRRWHSLDLASTSSAPAGAVGTFATLGEWLRIAKTITFDDPDRQAAFERAVDWPQLEADIATVRALAARVDSPVVFSHNDLLAGNILVLGEGKGCPESPGDLTFIDFEYGTWNHRGFDIGNHWNEYAGLDCDYRKFPSPDRQEHFVRAYLAAEGVCTGGSTSGGDWGGRMAEAMRGVGAGEVRKVVREANVFSLASHMFWAVWAIVQSRYSAIDFDYLEYFQLRHGEMRRRLPAVLEMLEG